MSHWKTVCMACAILAAASLAATAQTFTVLSSYGGEFNYFTSPFVQGRDGNLYATDINNDYGHILKITPSGDLTVFHNFCPQRNCADGAYPFGQLVLGRDGNFYGTTEGGGNTSGTCGSYGCGVVYKITVGGTVSVLYRFSGGSEGGYPDWLIEGSDGNFYGTTISTIFKITSAGTLTTLHTFSGTDGSEPTGVVQGTDGNLYGTTHAGGKYNSSGCENYGCGTVFKSTTTGAFTSLHSFRLTDGALPYTPPAQAADGTFYDTTWEGPTGDGTIFSITSQGKAETVYTFTGIANTPTTGLLAASDGNLYGTTAGGGACDYGFIYSISQANVFSTVFDSCQYGFGGALFQATNGEFYGGDGTIIFSLNTGLAPFVSFVLPAGHIGQTIQILGQGFTGTTSVTFNGVAAAKFVVVSDTYLTAVVPKGATSGPVVVTTATGNLTSNPSFTVKN
jgi:uncharacterized repeat protein (TIGR03803 family)